MDSNKSGKHWIEWANTHAKNSQKVVDLRQPFEGHVREFIRALEAAGARVHVKATRRSANRAYLFHWAWMISLGKCKASHAELRDSVGIQWDHGDEEASKKGAHELVVGFNLAVPPRSTVAPALASNHIHGNAIDMDIRWDGMLSVKKKNGTISKIQYLSNTNMNWELHAVGKSYGVIKHINDDPHWSFNGR
jgi:hypothetical protein